MSKKMSIKVNYGRATIEANVNRFEPKNWVYVNFIGGGRMCLDANGDVVKGQSHRIPVVDWEERKRIVAEA